MKKYITIAALLAAGTAFANAATLIAQWNDFTDLQSDIGQTSLSVDLGTDGATYTDGVLSIANVAVANRASVNLSSAGLTGTTGFTLVMTISDWTMPPNGVLADMMFNGTGASGDNGIGIGRGNVYNVHWKINNEGSALTNVTGTTAVTAAGNLILTYNGENAYLYLDGNEVSSATKRTDLSGKSFTSLALGGMGGADVGNSSFKLSKMAIYSGVITAEQIAAGGYVPEPSAFGLLAGMGALALVASRRRRK